MRIKYIIAGSACTFILLLIVGAIFAIKAHVDGEDAAFAPASTSTQTPIAQAPNPLAADSPASNPLAANPATSIATPQSNTGSGNDIDPATTGYTVLASANAGRTIFAQKTDATTAQAAIVATLAPSDSDSRFQARRPGRICRRPAAASRRSHVHGDAQRPFRQGNDLLRRRRQRRGRHDHLRSRRRPRFRLGHAHRRSSARLENAGAIHRRRRGNDQRSGRLENQQLQQHRLRGHPGTGQANRQPRHWHGSGDSRFHGRRHAKAACEHGPVDAGDQDAGRPADWAG